MITLKYICGYLYKFLFSGIMGNNSGTDAMEYVGMALVVVPSVINVANSLSGKIFRVGQNVSLIR